MSSSMNKVIADSIYRHTRLFGLKIGEVEAKAGVSIGYISRLRKGNTSYSMSIDTLIKFAQAIGVDAATLISEPKLEQLEYIVRFDTAVFSGVEPTEQMLDTLNSEINRYIVEGGAHGGIDIQISKSEVSLIRDGRVAMVSAIDSEED